MDGYQMEKKHLKKILFENFDFLAFHHSSFNLYSDHSYLLIKVRQYDDIIFFLLRNPLGEDEWTGSYSKYPIELNNFLENDRKDGQFWIPEDVMIFTHELM